MSNNMDPHSAEIIRAMANYQAMCEQDERNARLGNKVREDGVDRCPCGCKYWENDGCVDCGNTVPEAEAVPGVCVADDDECFGPVINSMCNRHRFDDAVRWG